MFRAHAVEYVTVGCWKLDPLSHLGYFCCRTVRVHGVHCLVAASSILATLCLLGGSSSYTFHCVYPLHLCLCQQDTQKMIFCVCIYDLHVFRIHLLFIILLSLPAAGTVKWWSTLYCAIMGTRYYLPHSVFTTEAGLISWNYQIQADWTDKNGGTPYANWSRISSVTGMLFWEPLPLSSSSCVILIVFPSLR